MVDVAAADIMGIAGIADSHGAPGVAAVLQRLDCSVQLMGIEVVDVVAAAVGGIAGTVDID